MDKIVVTVERVKHSGKWVEIWAQNPALPADRSFDYSVKYGDALLVAEESGMEQQILNHGWVGLKLQWELKYGPHNWILTRVLGRAPQPVYLINESGGSWDDAYDRVLYVGTDQQVARTKFANWVADLQRYRETREAARPKREDYPYDPKDPTAFPQEGKEEVGYWPFSEAFYEADDAFKTGPLGWEHRFYEVNSYELDEWRGRASRQLERYPVIDYGTPVQIDQADDEPTA
jgi:hypothetical protein